MKVHSKYDSKEHGVQYNVQVRTRYPTRCTVVYVRTTGQDTGRYQLANLHMAEKCVAS